MRIKYTSIGLAFAVIALIGSTHAAQAPAEFAASGANIPLVLQYEQAPESSFELGLQTGWASKYISEGVDSFGEGGIWEFNPELMYQGFALSLWYGVSDSINASELKIMGSYEFKLTDQLSLIPSFEHAVASPGREEAETPAVGLAYEALPWLTVGGDVQWDVRVGRWNGYYDVFVEVSHDLCDRVTVAAMALYAFNDGFLGEGVSHGSNTLDYSVRAEVKLTERLLCSCSLNYSQALTALKQASSAENGRLGDEFWVGTYLHYHF